MIEHVKPTARIPAVQGQFGPRLVTYTTQLPAAAIETILGHDPRSKNWKTPADDIAHIYQHLQRAPPTKTRLDAMTRYIRYRFGGAADYRWCVPRHLDRSAVQHSVRGNGEPDRQGDRCPAFRPVSPESPRLSSSMDWESLCCA